MFGGGEIREKMSVYDRGGKFVGRVECVEGASIRLAGGARRRARAGLTFTCTGWAPWGSA
jgi:hypothetical protein